MKNENGKITLTVGMLLGVIFLLIIIIIGLMVYKVNVNENNAEVSEKNSYTETSEDIDENANHIQKEDNDEDDVDNKSLVKEKFKEFEKVREDAFTNDLNTNKTYPENSSYVLAPKFNEKVEKICIPGFFDDSVKKLGNDVYVAFVDINTLEILEIKDLNCTKNKIEAQLKLNSFEGGAEYTQNAKFVLVKENDKWLVQKLEFEKNSYTETSEDIDENANHIQKEDNDKDDVDNKSLVKEKFKEFERVREDAFTNDLNTNKTYPENSSYVLAPKFNEKVEKICIPGFFDDSVKKLGNDVYIAFVDINTLEILEIKDLNCTKNKIEAQLKLNSFEGGEEYTQNAKFVLVKENNKWLVQEFEFERK